MPEQHINDKDRYTSASLEEELTHHFLELVHGERDLKDMRHEFQKTGHLNFPTFSFLPKRIIEGVHREVHALLAAHGVRRDVRVASTGNTRRTMVNVNQPEIKQDGTLIDLLYDSNALKNFLGTISSDDLVSCWEEEKYLITRLSEPGDTHGWHWGDYPHTLIWIVEAPQDPSVGGILQCIPHTEWDKKDPRIWDLILTNDIRSYHHKKGDVYYLKSDTTLHHVVPMSEVTERVILNTCWASKHDRREHVAHESVEVIWGVEPRPAGERQS